MGCRCASAPFSVLPFDARHPREKVVWFDARGHLSQQRQARPVRLSRSRGEPPALSKALTLTTPYAAIASCSEFRTASVPRRAAGGMDLKRLRILRRLERRLRDRRLSHGSDRARARAHHAISVAAPSRLSHRRSMPHDLKSQPPAGGNDRRGRLIRLRPHATTSEGVATCREFRPDGFLGLAKGPNCLRNLPRCWWPQAS